MSAPRLREVLSLVVMVAIAACGGGGTEPSGTNPSTAPAAVVAVSGNGQSGLVGTQLSLPLVVKVTTSAGAAVAGANVNFVVTSGAASVSPATAATDAAGQAKTTVTLGSTAGNVTVTATVAGTALSTSFVVTAGSSTVSTACSTGSPQTLALGEVRPGVSGSGLCLAGGAEYALIAFNANPDSNLTQATVTVKSQGAVAVTTADQAPAFNVIPGGAALQPRAMNLQRAFDMHLRETARRELTPMIPAARMAYNSRRAAFNAIPATVNVGDMLTLNANGNQACSNQIPVRARVAAITNNAVIVADTTNPAGGFTDAEYAAFGTTFDTLVNPLDIGAFGQPTDIDGNHRILILFTKEVNKLTPRGSFGFIGGFFFERDLFPVSNTSQLQGCAGSNVGEMFYLLVPDPNAVYSDKRTKTDVLNNTIGTLAHEYQHLINASRRLYINNANDFETVWLNEGLSHIAEELAYYRVTNLGPRQNIGITVIGADSVSVNRFNEYEADNFGRYEVFLGKPNQTGVWAANDSLETRGATWSMLRYLADHRGSSDADTWQLLVNSSTEGLDNLQRVFGTTLMTQIRDWATAVFTDDLSGVADANFQQPSWKFREIFPRLRGSNGTALGKYPLTVVPLADAAPANVNIVAGGVAYLRFSVNTGGQGSIDWTAAGLPVSPFVQFTIVRTK